MKVHFLATNGLVYFVLCFASIKYVSMKNKYIYRLHIGKFNNVLKTISLFYMIRLKSILMTGLY